MDLNGYNYLNRFNFVRQISIYTQINDICTSYTLYNILYYNITLYTQLHPDIDFSLYSIMQSIIFKVYFIPRTSIYLSTSLMHSPTFYWSIIHFTERISGVRSLHHHTSSLRNQCYHYCSHSFDCLRIVKGFHKSGGRGKTCHQLSSGGSVTMDVTFVSELNIGLILQMFQQIVL